MNSEGGETRAMAGLLARLGLRSMQRWLEAGVDLLFPPRCAGCGAPGQDWCQACDAEVHRILPPICRQCGRPLGRGGRCPDCTRKPFPMQARAYALYAGPLVPALLQLKYRPNRRLADVMSAWLAEIACGASWSVDLVASVPLSARRERVRGYNQVDLVARRLSRRLGVEFAEDALVRVRETRSQVGLDSVARAANVEGAFRARPEKVDDRSVLIVDDLFTTGATMVACHTALLQAGARQTFALAVARARGG
jgi:ComF family protein